MNDSQIVAIGAGLSVLGTALVVLPGVGSAGVPTIATTALLLTVLCVGLLVAARSLADREGQSIQLPVPEHRPQYPATGARIDELLDAVGVAGNHAAKPGVDESVVLDAIDDPELPREQLRTELHELAVEVLCRTTGCSEETARDRLAEGSWTDNTAAAAFFTADEPPELSWRHQLPGVPGPELPTVWRAKQVLGELSEMALDEQMSLERRAAGRLDEVYWPVASLPRTESTGRIRQLTIAVLVASSVGVLIGASGLVLVATLGVALAGTAQFSTPSATLTLSRTVSDRHPEPGDTVTVDLTVRNDSDRTVADLRLLDGVPAGLTVSEDSPRFTTSLRPGKATQFSYTVEAVEGIHTFEPAIAVASDVLGAVERVELVQSEGDETELACGFETDVSEIDPPRPQTTPHGGPVDSDATGSGVEFETVRAYRPGDPPSRIDWRHRAKTGELSTVDYVEPHRARTVIVVDDRAAAYVAAGDGLPAPRIATRVATAVASSLLENLHPVGLTTLSTACWLPPRCGDQHRQRIRDTLAGSEIVGWTPPKASPDVDAVVAGLTAHLEANSQLVVLTPLADDDSVAICRQLDAAGHDVTVFSPDCTDSEGIVATYGRLEHWSRRSDLRGADIPVVAFDPDQPLTEVIERERL